MHYFEFFYLNHFGTIMLFFESWKQKKKKKQGSKVALHRRLGIT